MISNSVSPVLITTTLLLWFPSYRLKRWHLLWGPMSATVALWTRTFLWPALPSPLMPRTSFTSKRWGSDTDRRMGFNTFSSYITWAVCLFVFWIRCMCIWDFKIWPIWQKNCTHSLLPGVTIRKKVAQWIWKREFKIKFKMYYILWILLCLLLLFLITSIFRNSTMTGGSAVWWKRAVKLASSRAPWSWKTFDSSRNRREDVSLGECKRRTELKGGGESQFVDERPGRWAGIWGWGVDESQAMLCDPASQRWVWIVATAEFSIRRDDVLEVVCRPLS